MEGQEHFSLDGVNYEAFSTLGWRRHPCETLKGRVRNLNYKTVRYPRQRDMIQMLTHDLKLCEHREKFKDLIEYGILVTHQDMVLIFVSVTGMHEDLLTQESYAKMVYGGLDEGERNAIQTPTVAGVYAMVDVHWDGKLLASGFVRQEDPNFDEFVATRFGKGLCLMRQRSGRGTHVKQCLRPKLVNFGRSPL